MKFPEDQDMTMRKSEVEEKIYKAPEYNKDEEADEQIKELIKGAVEREERRNRYFTAENRDRIIDLVRAGNGVTTAAKAVGVMPSTVYKWVRNGTEDIANEKDTEYSDFVVRLRTADATFETSIYEVLVNASQESGKEYMIQWILERKYPERFSLKKKQDLNINTKSGAGVTVTFETGFDPSMKRTLEEEKEVEEGYDKLADKWGASDEEDNDFYKREEDVSKK